MKILKAKKFALAMSAAFVLGMSGSAMAEETIKIAFAGPMTGSVKQYGDMVQEGYITAIEAINAAGGVNGKKLEAVLYDDACEPKQAVTVANKIVSDGIKFVVGHVCSGSTIPAADIYDGEGIVMITPSSTAPVLTEAKLRHSIFRSIGRDDQQAPIAAEYIVSKGKWKNIAIVHDKQSYGQGLASVVKAKLDEAKVPVVLFEGLNAGESDYSALITKLKSSGVDFVYFGGYHPELGLLERQAREQGLNVTFMGPEGIANSALASIAGAAVEGTLMTLPADFSADPENAKIVEQFKTKNRDASGTFQLPAYSAVVVIADAIKGAKSEDSVEVAEYIHGNTFNTPIGKIGFDKKGDLTNFKFVIYETKKDGSRVPAP
ncbi:high-affinity branched-chain amino acid ABC transporter substrate-binding protein [Microvirga sp. W0021]|uniref:High-affinity branched-chain amino acid ABC transporter substrate-binding protein n=1 Tax=Hohaiivirga grylli TaxID=3133970 RepID=A0ABV0BJW6_9HYPH